MPLPYGENSSSTHGARLRIIVPLVNDEVHHLLPTRGIVPAFGRPVFTSPTKAATEVGDTDDARASAGPATPPRKNGAARVTFTSASVDF